MSNPTADAIRYNNIGEGSIIFSDGPENEIMREIQLVHVRISESTVSGKKQVDRRVKMKIEFPMNYREL